MNVYKDDIEKATKQNKNFRKVLFTAKHSQLVLMSLLPKEEIGVETHKKNDQFFRFEEGTGKCVIEGKSFPVKEGMAVLVPAGTEHNIINTSAKESLKFYTIYSPAHHPEGTIHKTKKQAENDKHPIQKAVKKVVQKVKKRMVGKA